MTRIKSLFCLANKKVKVIEEGDVSAVIHAVVQYKESSDFVNDTIEVGADAFIIRFMDYKNKVARPS